MGHGRPSWALNNATESEKEMYEMYKVTFYVEYVGLIWNVKEY